MDKILEHLANELKSKNIRLSHQRLKVLEYMIAHKNHHPTVEQIYKDLQKEVPTLSKTTIYSTLNTLKDAGLVKVVNIEDKELRYDSITDEHGHFKCESCEKVFDFDIDFDSLAARELKNFKIHSKDIYFKGLCPTCMAQQDKNSL